MARLSLSLAFVGFEQFYGLLSPGKSGVFQHTSILVQPHHHQWNSVPRNREISLERLRRPLVVVELPGTAPGSVVPIAHHTLLP